MKPKTIPTILLCYLLAIQLPFCFVVAQNSSTEITAFREGIPLTNITGLLPVSSDDNVIKVSVAGDIMMARKVAETIKENNDDFTLPFHNIKDYLEGIDIKIANLEAPITDSHLVSKRIIPCSETISGCCDLRCHFKTDERVVEGLDYSGLNLLLLENNHIDDYYHGRQDTIDTLDAANMTWIDAYHPLEILNYKGCNLSFFNYDAVLHTEDEVQNLIENELKNAEQNSFKTVLIHAGKEYAFNETLKQRELAHTAINSGADIVLFSHAHVVLGHEVYKGKYIFWGLGNFVFDQFFSDRVKQFLMVKFDIVNCTAVDNVELVTGVIDEESQPTYENSVFL